jgi:hypothetical protein
MGVKLGPLKLRDEHRLRLLTGIFAGEWQEGGEDCTMRSFVIYTFH